VSSPCWTTRNWPALRRAPIRRIPTFAAGSLSNQELTYIVICAGKRPLLILVIVAGAMRRALGVALALGCAVVSAADWRVAGCSLRPAGDQRVRSCLVSDDSRLLGRARAAARCPGHPAPALRCKAKGLFAADTMRRYLEAHDFSAFVFSGQWADLRHHVALGRPLNCRAQGGSRQFPLRCLWQARTDTTCVA